MALLHTHLLIHTLSTNPYIKRPLMDAVFAYANKGSDSTNNGNYDDLFGLGY